GVTALLYLGAHVSQAINNLGEHAFLFTRASKTCGGAKNGLGGLGSHRYDFQRAHVETMCNLQGAAIGCPAQTGPSQRDKQAFMARGGVDPFVQRKVREQNWPEPGMLSMVLEGVVWRCGGMPPKVRKNL